MSVTNTADATFSRYQKFIVAILAALQFTVVLDFMVLSPLGDILMKSLHITASRFGLVVSAYAFSAGLSGILAAGFSDRYDRKKILLFFYSGFILGTLCCALATNFWALLGARIITGIFGGVIGATTMAIITDLFLLNQRGRVMGIVQLGFAASQVLGIPIGLYLANLWNWHASFYMIVLLALLIGLLVFVKMKPIDQHLSIQRDKNAIQHLLHTLRNPQYQVAFLATAFLSVGGFMLMPFGSAYLINNLNIHQNQLPLIFLCTGIASIVIMPLVGKLSDRIDKFLLFSMGSILAVIMILIYTNLSPVPLWVLILINMILFMGIMSRMIPAMALTSAIPDPADRGAFMSVNGSLQQMAGGIAALSAGMIVFQRTPNSPLEHYNWLGIVVSSVVILCLLLVYRVSKLVKLKQATHQR